MPPDKTWRMADQKDSEWIADLLQHTAARQLCAATPVRCAI
jgi:hypothetical protein